MPSRKDKATAQEPLAAYIVERKILSPKPWPEPSKNQPYRWIVSPNPWPDHPYRWIEMEKPQIGRPSRLAPELKLSVENPRGIIPPGPWR
jgi:hypothetical protein